MIDLMKLIEVNDGMYSQHLIPYAKYLCKNKQEVLLVCFQCSVVIWGSLKVWNDYPILGPIAMVSGIVLVIVKGVGRMIHSELKALKERYDSVSASNADK